MAGSDIDIRFDDAITGRFKKLRRAMRDTTPIMRQIGNGLARSTRGRMARGVDPEGRAWAPLNPLYAANKRGPGILRGSGMRGGLMGSITFRAGNGRVQIGTNRIYGAIHQYGGVIRPKNGKALKFMMGGRVFTMKSVTIPKRPYLGLSSADRDLVQNILAHALAERGLA